MEFYGGGGFLAPVDTRRAGALRGIAIGEHCGERGRAVRRRRRRTAAFVQSRTSEEEEVTTLINEVVNQR